jgi:hypothetical protein
MSAALMLSNQQECVLLNITRPSPCLLISSEAPRFVVAGCILTEDSNILQLSYCLPSPPPSLAGDSRIPPSTPSPGASACRTVNHDDLRHRSRQARPQTSASRMAWERQVLLIGTGGEKKRPHGQYW